MTDVRYFSPGKIILTGEHSVVYGAPAVVTTLDRGVSVRVSTNRIGANSTQNKDGYLQHILNVFSQEYTVDTKGLYFDSESKLYSRSGMGSSAAYAYAVLQALAAHFGLELQKDEFYTLCFKSEMYLHGNPSGIDPCAVVYGGTHLFKKSVREKNLGFSKKQLTIKKPETFLLVHSGQAIESTGEMVSLVAERSRTKKVKAALEEVAVVSARFAKSLEKGTFSGDIIDENQALLETIGVVSPIAKEIINTIKSQGGFAKITGAGGKKAGSGFILAYFPNMSTVRKCKKNINWESFTSTIQ